MVQVFSCLCRVFNLLLIIAAAAKWRFFGHDMYVLGMRQTTREIADKIFRGEWNAPNNAIWCASARRTLRGHDKTSTKQDETIVTAKLCVWSPQQSQAKHVELHNNKRRIICTCLPVRVSWRLHLRGSYSNTVSSYITLKSSKQTTIPCHPYFFLRPNKPFFFFLPSGFNEDAL